MFALLQAVADRVFEAEVVMIDVLAHGAFERRFRHEVDLPRLLQVIHDLVFPPPLRAAGRVDDRGRGGLVRRRLGCGHGGRLDRFVDLTGVTAIHQLGAVVGGEVDLGRRRLRSGLRVRRAEVLQHAEEEGNAEGDERAEAEDVGAGLGGGEH